MEEYMYIHVKFSNDEKDKCLSGILSSLQINSTASLFLISNLSKIFNEEISDFSYKTRMTSEILNIVEGVDCIDYIVKKHPNFHEYLWKRIAKKLKIEISVTFDSDIYYGTYEITDNGKIHFHLFHSYPKKKKVMISSCGREDCYKHPLVESYEYVSDVEDNWLLDDINWRLFKNIVEKQ